MSERPAAAASAKVSTQKLSRNLTNGGDPNGKTAPTASTTHRIDDQMIVKERIACQTGEVSCDGELPASGRAVQEDELHPARVDAAGSARQDVAP